MTNNYIKLSNGAKILLYRGHTPNGSLSATQYLPETKFKLGVDNTTPVISDNDLVLPIPINDGVVNDDGSNTFTGSSGGDNSTDNTTTYKPGANLSDNTAQNLIANDTNATKIWTIADLSSAGVNITATKYGSAWLYIKDATTLAKIVSIELKLGSDASNYYSVTILAANLAVGWNLITEAGLINTWTETGSTGTPVDTLIIEIITNNATDTFVAGDVIYDLLRSWDYADTVKDYVASYPSIDYTNLEVTKKGYLTSIEAVGYDINGYLDVNEDSTPLATNEATFTAESKADTDELIFLSKNRILL